jgi:cation diffusion facilitator CzcD-associated flavoprotein CzcO
LLSAPLIYTLFVSFITGALRMVSSSLRFFIRPRRLLPMTRGFSTHRAANVLIVGGGYGGLSTALNLMKLGSGKPQLSCPLPPPELNWAPQTPPQIVLIDERDGICRSFAQWEKFNSAYVAYVTLTMVDHLMGAPLVQTSADFALESWLRFEDIIALKKSNFHVLQGKVTALDASSRTVEYITSDGGTQQLNYDYAVLATGKRRSWPVAPRAWNKESYLQDSRIQLTNLSKARRIAIVGGGAVGIEMAGEIKRTWPEALVTLIHSRSSLLSSEPLPLEFREKALDLLQDAGVQVKLGCRVIGTRKMTGDGHEPVWEFGLSNGEALLCDEMVDTISRVKSESYVPSNFLNKSGELLVTST